MQYTEELEVEADNETLARHSAGGNYDDWVRNHDDTDQEVDVFEI